MDASQLSKHTKKHQNQTDTENMASKVQNKCKNYTKQAWAELGQAQPGWSSTFLILPILGADISLQGHFYCLGSLKIWN